MHNPMLDAALSYAERGLPIFPARFTKEPYTKNGVTDATTDPKQIRAWWEQWPGANIGLNCGDANFLVLDLDPGHDMAQLEVALGEKLPATGLKSVTPRGGFHLFYHLADGEVVPPSVGKLAYAVDVRSFNSYVLLPPSKTKDGEYTWESEGKPAFRSDALYEKARAGLRERHKDRDTWLIEPDLPENVQSAIEWCHSDKARPAIEGAGGDQMAYNTAAMMHSYGLSPETALEVMWEHWNPKCIPPWSADEYEHFEAKVRNGYQYPINPPGNMTPAYHAAKTQALFKAVEKIGDGDDTHRKGRFRIVNYAGLCKTPPISYLIDDCLPNDAYCIMFGASGTFKTFLALDMALSVALGQPETDTGVTLWPKIAEAGPVLFAVSEGRGGILARVQAWSEKYYDGQPIPDFYVADPVPHVGDLGTDAYKEFIAVATSFTERYKLVVIDTIGRAMQGVNENAQEHASKFTALVEALRRDLGCTVLALHHTGHEAGNRERGSVVFGADADTRIRIERPDPKAFAVELHMVKQKDAPEWEQPRHATLEKVSTSLVAVKAKTTVPTKAAPSAPLKAEDKEIAYKMIDEELARILKADPGNRYTMKELAVAIEGHPKIEVSVKTLCNTHLPILRADKATHAHRCFVRKKTTGGEKAKVWTWVPPATEKEKAS